MTSRPSRVVPPQPRHEVDHVGVPPDPRREAPKVGERLPSIGVVAQATHVTVDAIGVGPVTLDGHGREALVGDEPWEASRSCISCAMWARNCSLRRAFTGLPVGSQPS
jgi:hypothetical protein